MTICPVALLTGIPCPGCGMTRALNALVRGDWAEAWLYHPISFLVATQLLVLVSWWMTRRLGLLRSRSLGFAVINIGVTAFALSVVWVIRLSLGTLPPV